MNGLEDLIKCKVCNDIYTNPICLQCCGGSVCRTHIDKFLSDDYTGTLRCPLCCESLPKQKFPVEKAMQSLIDDVRNKKLNNPEYQLSSFKQRVEDMKNFHAKSEKAKNEKYSELKREVNSCRENFKSEMDKFADELIKKLDSYENDARSDSGCYDELLNEMKRRLDGYEKLLVSFTSTDEERKSESKEIEKEMRSLDKKINDCESKSICNKAITYESMDGEMKKLFGKLTVSV